MTSPAMGPIDRRLHALSKTTAKYNLPEQRRRLKRMGQRSHGARRPPSSRVWKTTTTRATPWRRCVASPPRSTNDSRFVSSHCEAGRPDDVDPGDTRIGRTSWRVDVTPKYRTWARRDAARCRGGADDRKRGETGGKSLHGRPLAQEGGADQVISPAPWTHPGACPAIGVMQTALLRIGLARAQPDPSAVPNGQGFSRSPHAA
jgi:hypothetical protein